EAGPTAADDVPAHVDRRDSSGRDARVVGVEGDGGRDATAVARRAVTDGTCGERARAARTGDRRDDHHRQREPEPPQHGAQCRWERPLAMSRCGYVRTATP